jgi:ribokinase
VSKTVSIRVIGSINLDIVASAPTLPRAGETITGATLAYHPGGKGANQALAAQRLGGQVTLLGRVGADAAADQALALLRASGVNISGVRIDHEYPTGVALIAVAATGENQIVVAPGANDQFGPNLASNLGAAKFDATICQLEIPIPTIEAISARVDGFFAINLAPAQEIPASILARADLIVVNETEAAFYGTQLLGLSGLVVVTLGAQGAVMYQGQEVIATAKPPTVVPIDTTGAGDTFVGALVLALMEGQDRQDAMNFACAAGAAATLVAGAQPSMPNRETVLALMETRA